MAKLIDTKQTQVIELSSEEAQWLKRYLQNAFGEEDPQVSQHRRSIFYALQWDQAKGPSTPEYPCAPFTPEDK